MENKIFNALTWFCTFGIILFGLFIIFVANYGIALRNIILIILESTATIIAGGLFKCAATSFYDYCDEDEEKEKEKE